MQKTAQPLDVWFKFTEDYDPEMEHPEYEANTYKDDSGYRIEWYHNDVGLVTNVYFDTLAEAHAWYAEQGYDDYSS